MDLKYLGGNAVNLLYQYKGFLPGADWCNLVLDGTILPEADLSGKNFSFTSLQYANLDNVNFTGANFSHCNLTDVRLEETSPVQSVAIAPTENILALYLDGIIRESPRRGGPMKVLRTIFRRNYRCAEDFHCPGAMAAIMRNCYENR